MTSHIISGVYTEVHSLSPSLMLYFNTSKGIFLSTSVDNSYIPSKIHSRKPSICTRMVPKLLPPMEHSGTPNDEPYLKLSSSTSLEKSVRQIIEVQSVQVLHLLQIQLESFQDFHQICLPLCLHILTPFMPSHFISGEPILFHSFTPPMIL